MEHASRVRIVRRLRIRPVNPRHRGQQRKTEIPLWESLVVTGSQAAHVAAGLVTAYLPERARCGVSLAVAAGSRAATGVAEPGRPLLSPEVAGACAYHSGAAAMSIIEQLALDVEATIP
jgi:hypothetical protein